MARMIGIDLGGHTVKVAVFEVNLGRQQLVDIHLRAVEQDGENPPTRQGRIDALAAVLDELGAGSWRDAVAAYPSDRASLRLVRLPFSDREQVERTLPFEVENQVPFDLDDMVLVPRIVETGEDGSRVLVALATRDRVAGFLEPLAELGADPKALVVDADLLSEYADEGVQAVVDIGHTRTVVALCRDGRLVTARALSSGGRALTAALAERAGLSWGEAEGRKHVASVADPGEAETVEVEPSWSDETGPAVDEWLSAEPTAPLPHHPEDGAILREAIEPLLVELRATLIALEDILGTGVDEVLITGGTAHLRGLRGLLASTLGVPVRHADLGEDVDDRDEPGRFAIARALGSRALRGRALDLRTGDFAFRGDLATLGNLLKYGAVAVAVFLVVGLGMFTWRSIQLHRAIDETEQQIREAVLARFPDVPPDKLSSPSMALAIMQERTTEVTSRVDRLGSLLSEEPPMLDLVRRLSEAMPPPSQARIDVRELSVGPTGITIKAETDGYEAATRIESALQAAKGFEGARKGDEKKSRNGVRFNITIPRGEDDAGEEG